MADSKATGLVELDPPALEDLLYVVDDPSGSPISKKVTLQNVMELAPHWVDRGDPSDWDYEETDLTTDGNFHDLDLSAIVPAGATIVRLCGYLIDNAVNWMNLRKNGNSNSYNKASVTVNVADQAFDFQLDVFCDTDRVIEYAFANTTWTAIKIVVAGWYTDTVN